MVVPMMAGGSIACLVLLAATTASADPLAPPALTPPITAADPMAARLTVGARSAARNGDCTTLEVLRRRVRKLDRAYHDRVFAADPLLARCKPGVRIDARGREVHAIVVPRPRLKPTGELGIGGGMWQARELGASFYAPGGPSLAVGVFVTPALAISLRVAGTSHLEDGFVYLGLAGAAAQYWLSDRVWLGGGFGVGFAAGCGRGVCGGDVGYGAGARVGYALRSRPRNGPNISFEMTAAMLDAPLQTYSLLVGYQTF
jgi:hypothetical protein